jgi:phenylalanyl-tRNA synthetase alpha subunit
VEAAEIAEPLAVGQAAAERNWNLGEHQPLLQYSLPSNMLEQSIQDLLSRSLARIESAQTQDELEAVASRHSAAARRARRVQQRTWASLRSKRRSASSVALNDAKQRLEARVRIAPAAFTMTSRFVRLDTEWLDLTLPAPGPRRGHLHPITRIQRELEGLFSSLGFTVLDGPEVETEYYNFDALNIHARPPCARHAGHVLAGWRPPAAHTLRPCRCAGWSSSARRCA